MVPPQLTVGGVTGPYFLTATSLIIGSEQIRVETRDRRFSEVVRESRVLVVRSAEPLPDLERERAGKVRMIEDGLSQRRREDGIAGRDRLRFAPDRLPEFLR